MLFAIIFRELNISETWLITAIFTGLDVVKFLKHQDAKEQLSLWTFNVLEVSCTSKWKDPQTNTECAWTSSIRILISWILGEYHFHSVVLTSRHPYLLCSNKVFLRPAFIRSIALIEQVCDICLKEENGASLQRQLRPYAETGAICASWKHYYSPYGMI